MAPDFVEAILTWSGAEGPGAGEWLAARGFTVVPMQNGLLVTGPGAQFERVFGIRLDDDAPAPAPLRLPPELAAHVASFVVASPRHYH
jgi:hypothetical protein